MSIHDVSDRLHADAEEFLASFRVARIRLRIREPISFHPSHSMGLAKSWAQWLKNPFRSLIAPAFLEAYRGVRAPELKWLKEADLELVKGLGEEEREGSVGAGEELLLALEGARHLGVTARYRRGVMEGLYPGNFAVALAARCASFHVPPVAALFGLCYVEWFGGRMELIGPGTQGLFLKESGRALDLCREAALAAGMDEFHVA